MLVASGGIASAIAGAANAAEVIGALLTPGTSAYRF
jgi:hypothetical protein